MKKTMIAFMSFLAITGCTFQNNAEKSVAAASTPNTVSPVRFNDIDNHWAKDAITSATLAGYVDGFEDGTFRPEQMVTRAEFIKLIISATKETVSGTTTGSDWYKPYAEAATKSGILRDTDFPANEMNTPISRLEMSRIAVRATDATFMNKAVQLDDKSAMYNATKAGLIQGLDRGELAPTANTTRAQSVTIIDRVLKLKSGTKLPVDKYAASNAELDLKKTNIFTMIPELFGGKQWEDASWNPENLYLETPDKKFKGTLDWVIAIDLADPNDPNRYLLGDVSKLTWTASSKRGVRPFVKDHPNSYILIFKTHVDYCDATEYACDIGLQAYPIGFVNPDWEAFYNGELNTLTGISLPGADIFPFILPKSGYQTDGVIQIRLLAPVKAFTQPIDKTVLGIVTSKQY
ncbi:S-layer homology domain-containing protein [Paenibacillus athensensis]|uniref:SLH domain-containing protein n=1 Tax=Paenibacillus athensensis TaxID=1967502 RepID=A0A4Y8PQ75_9BACL|nr:S-layer homology domain-containing protein [Paenibacillus athensensis]MCD1260386.1 S-layer homology domain-containing protein [Paenibacillus athensensis]